MTTHSSNDLTNGFSLIGGQFLHDGVFHQDRLTIQDSKLELGTTAQQHLPELDISNCTVFPGIIDLHGDAFERAITPRSGVSFPIYQGVAENDAALIASGITTYFYAITDGFEPGLRSRETVRNIMDQIDQLRPRLKANTFIHIRHETANLEKPEELIQWMEEKRIHLLSLNDHLPPLDDPAKVKRYRSGLQRRVSMSEEEVQQFLNNLRENRHKGEDIVEKLCSAAHTYGTPLASHDDMTLDDVEKSKQRQVAINEFPMGMDAAHAAQAANQCVILGAPNLVRGSSHVNGLSVREAIADDACDVLCSDYSYPALLRAPFLIDELGLMPLEKAWNLVSANPTKAAGLDSKGSISDHKDADLIIVDQLDGSTLSVRGVISNGQLALWRGTSPLH